MRFPAFYCYNTWEEVKGGKVEPNLHTILAARLLGISYSQRRKTKRNEKEGNASPSFIIVLNLPLNFSFPLIFHSSSSSSHPTKPLNRIPYAIAMGWSWVLLFRRDWCEFDIDTAPAFPSYPTKLLSRVAYTIAWDDLRFSYLDEADANSTSIQRQHFRLNFSGSCPSLLCRLLPQLPCQLSTSNI